MIFPSAGISRGYSAAESNSYAFGNMPNKNCSSELRPDPHVFISAAGFTGTYPDYTINCRI